MLDNLILIIKVLACAIFLSAIVCSPLLIPLNLKEEWTPWE